MAITCFEGFLDCDACLAWGGLKDLMYQLISFVCKFLYGHEFCLELESTYSEA